MFVTYSVLTMVFAMIGIISTARSFGAFDPKEDR